MSIDMSHRSFSSKKLAMVAAANILRIGIGLATATSANPVRQHPSFYPNKSYARASDQANGNGSTAAARERQAPMPAVVERPDFGWG